VAVHHLCTLTIQDSHWANVLYWFLRQPGKFAGGTHESRNRLRYKNVLSGACKNYFIELGNFAPDGLAP
jgi:hypothetical protein